MSSARTISLPPPATHRKLLLTLSCSATALTLLITVLSSQLPLFDSSPRVVLPPPSPSPLSLSHAFAHLRYALASAVLRWDTFYFASIAQHGYQYEQQAAFFPETPLVMRVLGSVVRVLSLSDSRWEDVLLGGLVASVLTAVSAVTLYDLSLLQLGQPNLAFLAALLSLFPSSPVTLRVAACTEPFFTAFSYLGMLACARKQWLFAAWSFMLAGTFRSNGILLSGFLVWGIFVEPILERRHISVQNFIYAATLSLLTTVPFVYHHYLAYQHYCVGVPDLAPWCSAFPPLIYTYVQSKYWNVGFLRYWTVQQLPNFLLAAPPLTLLFSFTTTYLRTALAPRVHALLLVYTSRTANPPPIASASPSLDPKSPDPTSVPTPTHNRSPSPFLRAPLAPHALHALALSLILLFASHTQIALRVAASMPLTYWAATWLLVERPALGRLWVAWSVVWGAVSCVLWGVFLPPA